MLKYKALWYVFHVLDMVYQTCFSAECKYCPDFFCHVWNQIRPKTYCWPLNSSVSLTILKYKILMNYYLIIILDKCILKFIFHLFSIKYIFTLVFIFLFYKCKIAVKTICKCIRFIPIIIYKYLFYICTNV